MNSVIAFTGVGQFSAAGMPRTHRGAAPITVVAAHIAAPAAAPVERKRRAAIAAAATGASVKRGTT